MTWFLLHPSGHRYPIGPNGLSLGRAIENDVVLADEEISRRHAAIQFQDEQIWLHDRNSFNGVFVNEQRLAAPQLLRPGDVIRLGHTRLVIEQTAAAPAGVPAAAVSPPARPAPASQTRQAALVGGLLGLAGVAIVAILVLRPLWGGQGTAPTGGAQASFAQAARASAFLLTPIADSPNSVASTGAVLGEKGRILAAYAAVYDPATHQPYNRRSQVLVGLSSDPGRASGTLDRWYLARIVRADHQRDLAVLQIFAQQNNSPLPNSFSWPALATSPAAKLRPGAAVSALSFPSTAAGQGSGANAGQVLALGQGQVAGLLPDPALGAAAGWLQTSLGLGPGNLGALVVDANGRLVGLFSGGADVRAIEVAEPLLKGSG